MTGWKRYYAKGRLVRMRGGGYDIKITSDTIKVAGYSEWFSVSYMTRNEDREHCVDWVLSLIERGVLKKEPE